MNFNTKDEQRKPDASVCILPEETTIYANRFCLKQDGVAAGGGDGDGYCL